MARKQAKRRRLRKSHDIRLPKIPLARLVTVAVAISIVTLTYRMSLSLLDRPITAITVDGPFQRVQALQIEEAISAQLSGGFLSADLSEIQHRVAALPWIDNVNVVRRWPSRLQISVTEQIPAACWGESGLLNTRGELFVTDARHIPAELPRLSGPAEQAATVAKRYLSIREKLIPLGLDVRELHVDARGAWNMTLQNGIEIRLGRRDVESRSGLFLDVVADIVSSREAEIEFADMRYSNGFTIGWKDAANSPASGSDRAGEKLLAGRVR